MYLPYLEEEEFFENLFKGRYRNIVILTGAGISTSAGIPDFRTSSGGLFDLLKSKLEDDQDSLMLDGKRVRICEPEQVLSRIFRNANPSVWQEHILPLLHQAIKLDQLEPTMTHRFCAYLAQQGWLKRIYTQNVDGLHTHESLCYRCSTDGEGRQKVAEDFVVECHGSLRRNDMVLYGDPLPQRFSEHITLDFEQDNNKKTLLSESNRTVDLVMVFGTSLRVAPVCAVPNLAPKHCHRVLINRAIGTITDHNRKKTPPSMSSAISIGKHKHVTAKSLWDNRTKVRKKRWRQLLVEGDCDDFVNRFCESTGIQL
jgi:NAD-dependent SIR2 family protein deacetylase